MTVPLERIESLLMELIAKNSELEKKVDMLSSQLALKRGRKPKKHNRAAALDDGDRSSTRLPLSSSETFSEDNQNQNQNQNQEGRATSLTPDESSEVRRPVTPKLLRDMGEKTIFPGAMGVGLDRMLLPPSRRPEFDNDSSADLDSNAKFDLFVSMIRKAVQRSPVLQSTASAHSQDLLLVSRMLSYVPVVWADCFQSITHTRNAFSFELVGLSSSSSSLLMGSNGHHAVSPSSTSEAFSLCSSDSTTVAYEQPSLQRVLMMLKNEDVNELRRLLINGCGDSYDLAEGNTLLHLAAHNRSLKLCSLLLGNDFSLLKQNMQGEPALFSFLASDQNPYATDIESLFRLLLGFDTDWLAFRCKYGNSILHAAAVGNSPALVRLCLAHGASAHAVNKAGARPLDVFIRYSAAKEPEIAQLLFTAEMDTLELAPTAAGKQEADKQDGASAGAAEGGVAEPVVVVVSKEKQRRKAEVARLYQLLHLVNVTAKDKPLLHEWVLGRLFQLLDLVYDERDNDSGLNRLSADIRQSLEAGVLRSVSDSADWLTSTSEAETETETNAEAKDHRLTRSRSTESLSKVLHLRAVTLPRLIALVTSTECQPLDLVFLAKVCATSTYVWGAQRPYIDLLAALLLEHLSAEQMSAYSNMCVLLYEQLLPMTVEELTTEHATVLGEVAAQLQPRRSIAEARLSRLIEHGFASCTDHERRKFSVARLHMKNELPSLLKTQHGALPSLLQLDTRVLASTLTMWAVSLLAPVSSRQLIAHVRASSSSSSSSSSPSSNVQESPVRQAIFSFNLIGRWVATTILTVAESHDERVGLILKFLGVATACLSWHDYHTALAINAGFNHTAIFRLKQTWKDSSLIDNADLERLTSIANPTANYTRYRAAIEACPAGQPCIPYLPTLLSDLTFIHNGLPDFVGEATRIPRLINFLKCKWFFAITENLWEKIASATAYDFQLDPSAAAYLSSIDACESFTDESLQELSKKRRAEDLPVKLRRKHSSTFTTRPQSAGPNDSMSASQQQQSGAVGLWDCVPDFAKQEAFTPSREEAMPVKDKRKSNRFLGKQLKKSKKSLKNAEARVEGRGEISDTVAAFKSRRLLKQDSEESRKTDALLAGSQAQGFLDFVDDNDYCGASEKPQKSNRDKVPTAKERLRDFLHGM